MLLQELINKLKINEEQHDKLKKERKELIAKAKEERLLEINIVDLYKELLNLHGYKNGKIVVNPISVPKNLNLDILKAKKYIIENNIGLGVTFEMDSEYGAITVYKFTTPTVDAKLKNGENLIDNLSFKTKTQILPNNDIINDIVVNFGLDNPLLQKTFFKQAVLNCVEKKESGLTK